MMRIVLLLLIVGVCGSATAAPQSTAFTFQGRLQQNGTPTSGSHDLTFTLWDSASAGAQVGSTITQAGYPIASGVFTIDLDFGASVFAGQQRWLDIKVDGTELTPRQPVNSSPVATYALSAPNGTTITGNTVASSQFTNDRLYTGISLTGQNLPMVMIASPAFLPAGNSTQAGYIGGVDVYNLTSAVAIAINLNTLGGAVVGKGTPGDMRMLVAMDPAYVGLFQHLMAGYAYPSLQVDILRATGGPVVASYCWSGAFISALQPTPQLGVAEIAIVVKKVSYRIAKTDATGGINGYSETSWDFTTNTTTSDVCITPPHL
jgi:hypothetical protein